ncbi:hypothetical protein C8J56DRAFT_896309 [Mycena floridula]|nr:hypothetical protein C8J56DRAFT_896309 [Mycena floridula]
MFDTLLLALNLSSLDALFPGDPGYAEAAKTYERKDVQRTIRHGNLNERGAHTYQETPETGTVVMVKVTSLNVAYQAITDPELRDLDMDLDQIRRDAASPNKEARRAS